MSSTKNQLQRAEDSEQCLCLDCTVHDSLENQVVTSKENNGRVLPFPTRPPKRTSEAIFEKLITVEVLADALELAPQTIRNMVAKRLIPFVRVGRKTMFRRASIEAWLNRKEFKPCP